MSIRTTKKSITFMNAFSLGVEGEEFLPGTYEIEIDEELISGRTHHAYRRIMTLIQLPAKSGGTGLVRTRVIDPDILDAALTRDQAETKSLVAD